MATPLSPLRTSIAKNVRGYFRGPESRPFEPAGPGEGLFDPDGIAWTVHRDVTTMMIGGVTSLLVQMLHPVALAGVWDHSNFRHDMHGRLRRTAMFIARTTYGPRDLALREMTRVRKIHDRVTGTLPDGRAYQANDPEALAWVHLCETLGFLEGYRHYGERRLSGDEQDRYFAEMAIVGTTLGADPVPHSLAEALALSRTYRSALVSDARSRMIARILMQAPAKTSSFAPAHRMVLDAGADLMPGWARRLHGMPSRPLARRSRALSSNALAALLRWALAEPIPNDQDTAKSA